MATTRNRFAFRALGALVLVACGSGSAEKVATQGAKEQACCPDYCDGTYDPNTGVSYSYPECDTCDEDCVGGGGGGGGGGYDAGGGGNEDAGGSEDAGKPKVCCGTPSADSIVCGGVSMFCEALNGDCSPSGPCGPYLAAHNNCQCPSADAGKQDSAPARQPAVPGFTCDDGSYQCGGSSCSDTSVCSNNGGFSDKPGGCNWCCPWHANGYCNSCDWGHNPPLCD